MVGALEAISFRAVTVLLNTVEVTAAVLMPLSRSVSSVNPFIPSSDPHLLGDCTGPVGDCENGHPWGWGRKSATLSLSSGSRTSQILEQSTISGCFSF